MKLAASQIMDRVAGREKQFRVWDGQSMLDASDFNYEYLLGMDNDLWFRDSEGEIFPVKNIVMFCLHTRDRRDYRVYEGDILRDSHGNLGVVLWNADDYAYELVYNHLESEVLSEYDICYCLVVGNIYQHPDWQNWSDEE